MHVNENLREENKSHVQIRKSDDLVTKKHLLRSLTRNTELERGLNKMRVTISTS